MAISGGAIAGGIAGGILGAAPTLADKLKQNKADSAAGTAAAKAGQAQIAGDPTQPASLDPSKALDMVQQPTFTASNPLSSPDHPAWQVLNNMTGNPGNAPLPGAPQMLQNGGVVRLNNGSPVVAPEFEKGPAIPTGPNNTVTAPTTLPMQGMAGYAKGGLVKGIPDGVGVPMGQGITPASTEGQMLMFDAGGVVPEGYIPPAGNINVPMTGAAAGLLQGIEAGQSIGHNLHQAWLQNRNREAAAQYSGALAGVDVNNPNSGQSPDEGSGGFLAHAKNAVEGFFQHMNNVSLDDNHKPNGAQAVPAPGATDAAPSGPALPAGGSAVPTNAPPPGIAAPSPGSPAGPNPAAPVIPGAAPAAPAPNGGGPTQPSPPQPGSPPNVTPQAQATQVAVKSVAGNNEVRQGIPDKPPEQSGLPHSMTPDQWSHMNLLKQKAVMAAARAGEDPAKVYESLTAMQNAHFQGQILKQLGTANVAFQNGDMKSVEQALKNVNYYLPNGQDIQFKKADASDVAADPSVKPGDLMYKNPFYGMYGHENDPEYTKVDSQHIQSLGAAALDPRTVQEAQLKAYSVQQEAISNRLKATGELKTGQGREFTGLAAVQNANSRSAMADVDRRLKIAAGNKDQAEANWYNTRQPGGNTGQPKITMASLRSLQNDAANYTDRIVQGQPTTSPVVMPNGEPNYSPGAGKTIPNPGRVPAWATNGVDAQGKPMPLTPEQQENVKVLSGQINAANAGLPGMNTPKAVELAARITHYQSRPTTHPNPQTGKPEKDFVYDTNNGTAHVWVGNGWENVYLRPNVAEESGGGGGPESAPPSGNSAGGAGGEEPQGPDAFQ